MAKKKIKFVLGGNDAEIEVIEGVLAGAGVPFVQPHEEWGDHVYTPTDVGVKMISAKAPTMQGYAAGPDLLVPEAFDKIVFVECRPGTGWGDTSLVEIDHHGIDRADEASSVMQVVNLLGLKLSDATLRWVELIGANDARYIRGMKALGATPEEIQRIRALDREAQGVTRAHEEEAERAINDLVVDGPLTIIHMAHSKCATVTDRLHGECDQLVVLSEDGEVNFYGDGPVCVALKEKFGGWNGSGLTRKGPFAAYWGGSGVPQDEVVSFIKQALN